MAAIESHSLGSLHESRGEAPRGIAPGGMGSRQFLLVMTVDSLAIEPLPASGHLIVGRSKSADLRLEDPRVSGRHLRLCVGERLTVEDLGSTAGTRVAGTTLAPRTPTDVLPGEAISLGDTVLMVRETTTTERPQRIWSHAPFRLRVDEECERAGRGGAVFTLARVLVESSSPAGGDQPVDQAELIWGMLAAHAPPPHAVGMYGVREYELLLVGTGRCQAAERMALLQKALASEGCVAHAGLASFPEDGRASAVLLARANAHLFQALSAAAAVQQPDGPDRAPTLCLTEAEQNLIEAAAAHDRPLLFVGESGTGKETLAREIHRRSAREDQPFVVLEAASRTGADLERALFSDKADEPGAWAAASGGTLFVADADWLPTATLLRLGRPEDPRTAPRLIVTRTVDAPGAVAAVPMSPAAQMDRRRQLRRDPGGLLGADEMVLTPLRDRASHLTRLIDCLMANAVRARGRGPTEMTDEGRQWLEQRPWPGNVRELQNVIDHTVAASGLEPRAGEPPSGLGAAGMEANQVAPELRGAVAEVLMQTADMHAGSLGGERDRIVEALAACAFNQSRAAARLGISRRTLVARLGQFGIDRPLKQSS
jgi:two-component system response regulator AtoC